MLHSVGCAQVLTDAKFPRVVGTRFRPHSSLDPVAPSTQRELGSPFFRSRQSGCCPRRVWCGSSGARGTASRRLRSAAACRARRLRGASDVSRHGSRRVQLILPRDRGGSPGIASGCLGSPGIAADRQGSRRIAWDRVGSPGIASGRTGSRRVARDRVGSVGIAADRQGSRRRSRGRRGRRSRGLRRRRSRGLRGRRSRGLRVGIRAACGVGIRGLLARRARSFRGRRSRS